jgi:hypothetical protein
MLRRAEKGPQIHGEMIAVTVVVGDGFGTDFMDGVVDFDGADDLGCVEQGMDHGDEGCESVLPVDVIFRINLDRPAAKRSDSAHRFAPVDWSVAGG